MVALRLRLSVSRMCKGGVGGVSVCVWACTVLLCMGFYQPNGTSVFFCHFGVWLSRLLCLAYFPQHSRFLSTLWYRCGGKVCMLAGEGLWHPPFSVGLSFSLPPPHTGARERQPLT